LYRKYRSTTLDEIVGQSHVTSLLKEAIKQGRISHAYLLTGPRGVGKTSIARILAHEINHVPYDESATNLDIIEIDAASNNGVEDVRDLREKVQLAPVSAEKKIYIIDEVHMLSKPAFNALLKTLEEPPEHVVFILATTDVDKLPATIISRTQRFSFRAIGVPDAVKHLRYIADTEKIKITDDALTLIAERGDGSLRDSESLLDQLSSLTDDKTEITTELIEASLGLAPHTLIDHILDSVQGKDIPALVKLLDGAYDQGISGPVLASQLTARVREVVIEKPQLLTLLDGLLDVAKSAQPNLKLLSVLGKAATPKTAPKTAALAVPVLEVTATIAELEKKATQKKPKEFTNTSPLKALDDEATSSSKGDVPVKGEPSATGERELPVERPLEMNDGAPEDLGRTKIAGPAPVSTNFDRDRLVEHTRVNYVALYSVLSKCQFELDGKNLTIYAGNKFYKKKLDDAKYRPMIHKALDEVGVYELEIHTIPTGVPPRDSQAAAVAVIMGGGEEVSVEAS
jgi:DNA polymerase-3 subunit gamma/tau